MATKLKQIQSLKQKLAPRQVLQARLLQLNTVNLEQYEGDITRATVERLIVEISILITSAIS